MRKIKLRGMLVLFNRCMVREEKMLKLALYLNNPDLAQYYFARYMAVKELKEFIEQKGSN